MEVNRQLHWNILQEVGRDFADKVREFLVIGDGGEGVLMVTEPDGEGYWFGEMEFEWGESKKSKKATKPTRLGVSNLVRMAHGRTHILLLDGMGQIYTLGMNEWGQLGQGTVDKTINFTPQPITSPLRFIDVRCGLWHSLALTEDGKVWAWGDNACCQVGLSSSTSFTSSIPSPRQISKLNSYRVVAIECGAIYSLALTDQGQVYGWGDNHYGQLAQTNLSSQPTPLLLPSASPVTQIAAGNSHTLLLAEDGGVFACGANDSGQLGQPISSINQAKSTLCKVSGLPPISQIASHFGTNLSIALSTDRRCFVWGGCYNAKHPIPLQLPPIYSTIESPLSFRSTRRNTPHSVRIEVSKSSLTSDSGTQTDALTAQDSLQDRVSRMFDNPDVVAGAQAATTENNRETSAAERSTGGRRGSRQAITTTGIQQSQTAVDGGTSASQTIVSGTATRSAVPKENHTAVVRLLEGAQFKDVVSALTASIKPQNRGYEITSQLFGPDGSLTLELKTKDQVERFVTEVNATDALTATARAFKRVWIVRGVLKVVDQSTVTSSLVKALGSSTGIDHAGTKNNGNQKLVNHLFEVTDSSVVAKLSSIKRLQVGFQRLTVESFYGPPQCFKCWKTGHMAGRCTVRDQICGVCAGAHGTKDCSARGDKSKFRCVNCNADGHRSYDRSCPSFGRQ